MAANLVITIVTEASKAQKELKQTSQDVEGLGKSTSNMGKVIAAGAAAGVAGLVALGVSAFEAAQESARIGRETERVIRTTGAAAWTSAKQVSELAGAISDKTGADDEAVQSGANLLLTFTNVQNAVGEGNDVFDQATELALDMSTALGTDMSGAAIQLGKALNDPIKGITALSKAGVSFTEQQKEQIKALVESGDVLGAQKIVLAELRKEFGGAAETAGTSLDKLGVWFGNLQESIGAVFIPAVTGAADVLLEKLGPALEGATGFLADHTEGLKYLASVGLVGLAAAYGPVLLAQAALIGSGIVGFITSLTGYVTALGAVFLETAASEGVLAAVTGTLSLTMLPLVAGLLAVGGAVYAVASVMDRSSQTADDYFNALIQDTDLSNYDDVQKALEQTLDRMNALDDSIKASGWADVGASIVDVLVPFHDVENSLRDQENEWDALHQKMQETGGAVEVSKQALQDYATASVLAAADIQASSAACDKLTEASAATDAQIGAVNQKLLDIAKSEKIDLTTPDAVDRVQALYEKTLHTTTSTLNMSEAQEKYNDATATAKDKTDAYKASLDALAGIHLSAAEAQTNFSENGLKLLETLNKNKQAVLDMGDATETSGEKSLAQIAIVNENNSALQSSVKSAMDLANATYAETGSIDQATAVLSTHRQQLYAVMIQMGYTEDEANAYIDRLGLTPENIDTQVNLDNATANAGIDTTQGKLNVVGQGANAPVSAATAQAQDALGGVQGQLTDVSKGGHVTVTADTGPAKEELKGLGRWWKEFTTGLGVIGDAISGNRAAGGPVSGGSAYLVGERGPELFLPGRSGFIVPATQTASLMSGPSTVNVTINHTGLGIDSPRLQRDLVGALQRYTAREGPVRF